MTAAIDIEVLEQAAKIAVKQRGITLGLPCNPRHGDRRFPLTPEAVKTLVEEYFFRVYIEKGAGAEIHYSDEAYASHGATVTTRNEALGTDIVITASPLTAGDVKSMRRNAALWTLTEPIEMGREKLEALTSRGITAMSLVALKRPDGHRPLADILAEIDGRAAMAVAAGFLADGVHGKGILLGGVAGIVPCEVVIIGAGRAGIAAALSARGLGATVRMFDNDPCKLRDAQNILDRGIIGSSLHRKVYLAALRSADIVINTITSNERFSAIINADDASTLKKGVILFDFNRRHNTVFPSMRLVDLSPASESLPVLTERICFINVGRAVPRTSAMALSNALVPLLAGLTQANEHTFMDAVRMDSYLSTGLVTFGGKIVNSEAAMSAGMSWVDPSLLLRLS